ncbi:hypothetical protein I6D39_04810, partial [Staphylococcus aureus]|nr:hypothetical protein [Staphylococcus aureus]
SQEAQEIQEAKKETQAETDKSVAVSKTESQAERLANAAKQKQAKLTPGSKESQLTEALFAEKPVAKNDLKEIPQLITKKNDVSETVNTDNKDTVKQKEAKFENGVITRKADEKTTNNTDVDKKSGKQSKKTTPSNKRNASKASTNKTSGQKKQHNKKSAQGAKKQSSSSKSTQKNNQTSNKNSKTTNAKSSNASKTSNAKVEKAKSKIEKRTFND